MLEPSTVENLGKKNFLDKLNNGPKGQPIIDQTFNEVFSSLQKTDRKSEDIHKQSTSRDSESEKYGNAYEEDKFDNIDEYESVRETDYNRDEDINRDDETDYNRDDDSNRDDETEHSHDEQSDDYDLNRPVDSPQDSESVSKDEGESVDEPVVAEVEKPKEEAKQTDGKELVKINENKIEEVIGKRPHANKKAVLIKTANEAIQKINQLLKDDPQALKKLFDGTTDKTFGGILKSLGVGEESLDKLSKFVDLDQKLSEKAMAALKSGKPSALFNLLKKAGLDKNTLDGAFAAIERKLAGMKPQEQTEIVVGETEKETREDETDEDAPKENKIKNHGKHAKKINTANLQAAVQAKETANTKATAKTTQGSIDKAEINVGKGTSKDLSAPQSTKASTSNVDINITNNGSQKTEATQAPTKAQTTGKSTGFEKMLMNQIVEKVRVNIRQNGRSNMTIRLDPPSLGKVDVRVITHANMVQAVMVVESREVKAVAEGNLDSLKTALENSGLKVDEVVVTTADEGHQFKNQNLGQEAGSRFNNERHSSTPGGETGFGNENEIENITTRRIIHNGVLDVVA